MSLINIPFQPVQFGIDSDYKWPVKVADPIGFQIGLELCGNPDSELVNGDFSDGLNGWASSPGFGTPVVNSGIVSMTQNQALTQNVAGAAGNNYLVEITVVEVEPSGNFGVLVGWLGIGNNPIAQITEPGTYQVVLPGSIGIFRIQCTGLSCQVAEVQVYEWYEQNDIAVSIVDADGSEVQAIDSGNNLLVQNRVVVNFQWPELGSGTYRIKVEVCEEEYFSNWFCEGHHEGITALIFACNDADEAFGLYSEGFSPSMRVPLGFVAWNYPSLGREAYVDSAGKGTMYYAEFEKTKTIRTEIVPEWVTDWLGTLPGYSSVYVDGQKYRIVNSEVGIAMVETDEYRATVEIEMALDGIALVNVKCDEIDRNCTPPPNCLLTEAGEPVMMEDGSGCILLEN